MGEVTKFLVYNARKSRSVATRLTSISTALNAWRVCRTCVFRS